MLTCSEPGDTFEEAERNHYSLDVQDMLTTRKLNGIQPDDVDEEGLSTAHLLVQRCSVAQVTSRHKVWKSGTTFVGHDCVIPDAAHELESVAF